ncbi:hypothetical protein PRZ48_009299 [Zasmidium cellare]|uniref:BTB domain-containing protein n=1 Tax=Zasmidium cellare TaxID=395010 RepID=A0ABR0EBB5_ZASCE|nr:hypothetical protein PRZ48_009299 [Zasmidium cellare]
MDRRLSADTRPAYKTLQKETALRDFTIASQSGKEWKVHKLVLHMHSDVLYRMATSEDFIVSRSSPPWPELARLVSIPDSKIQECQTGRAVLKDVGDDCIDALVGYLYSLTVTLQLPPSRRGIPENGPGGQLTIKDCLAFYGGVWTLADMYNIPGLKGAMSKDFDRWLELRAVDLRFVENLLEVVMEGVALDVLEAQLMGFLARLWGTRNHRHSVEKVIALLEKYPDVAMEVLKVVVRRNGFEDPPSRERDTSQVYLVDAMSPGERPAVLPRPRPT